MSSGTSSQVRLLGSHSSELLGWSYEGCSAGAYWDASHTGIEVRSSQIKN